MNATEESWSNIHAAPEQMLWSAVLETALSNALTHRDPEEKRRAIKWFEEGGQHFKMVCDLANYEPSFVQKRVLDLIETTHANSLN
ncbi:MAG: hypothetical protein HQL72_06535 [Magnetococcales bacterium]|nr:hypothetical protein [Magnetococcales bacterium]